jgi:hypothetical protein
MVLTSCDQIQNQLKGAIAVLLSVEHRRKRTMQPARHPETAERKEGVPGLAAQRSAK